MADVLIPPAHAGGTDFISQKYHFPLVPDTSHQISKPRIGAQRIENGFDLKMDHVERTFDIRLDEFLNRLFFHPESNINRGGGVRGHKFFSRSRLQVAENFHGLRFSPGQCVAVSQRASTSGMEFSICLAF